MPWLINPAQLDKFRKSQNNVIICDASLHMQAAGRDAKKEFIENHIIGSQFFDIDLFSDPQAPTPHMLISDEKLISEKMGSLGLTNDTKIIFYDNSDLHSACRAVWMLKMFGHNPESLYVLDGGLNAWKKYGGKVEYGEPSFTAKKYDAHYQKQFIRTLAQMKMNLQDPKEQVIDMRHGVRFVGGAEVREGLRSGHIPNSFSFPFMTMFDKEGIFQPKEKLAKQLLDIGVDLNSPIVTTCGSAITATILNLVLDLLQHTQNAVYDGSWSEWGAEKLYPEEKSLAERPVETYLE